MAGFLDRFVRANAQLIADKLREIAGQLDHAAPGPPAEMIAGWVADVLPGQEVEVDMGEITLRDTDEAVNARVSFKDIHGHDTAPDDTPEWSSSDETVATAEAADDGMSCSVAPVGPGSAVIEVSSLDADGTEVRATGLVNVTAGEASVGEVVFDSAPAPDVPPAPDEPPVEPTA